MNKDGIPLPSALTGNIQERLIRIDEALLFLITGALTELTDDWRFEQTGSLTPEGAKDALNEMLWCFMEACTVQTVGMIAMWILSSTPSRWLRLNGQAVSRTAYADLFALYGTTFGVGDGTTTFNLPDLRDKSPYGVGSLIAVPGQSTGTVNETLLVGQIPAHNHIVTDPGHAHLEQITNAAFKGGAAGANSTFQGATTNSAVRATTDSATTGITTQNNGGGNPHNNVHPVTGVHYIVYAGA